MSPEGVRKILSDREDIPKELRLNDGSRVIVRGRERWMVALESLHVLDARGESTFVDYRNITAIRHLESNGRRSNGHRRPPR